MWGVVECDVCGKQQFIVSGFSLEFCVELEKVKAETSWHKGVYAYTSVCIYVYMHGKSFVVR